MRRFKIGDRVILYSTGESGIIEKVIYDPPQERKANAVMYEISVKTALLNRFRFESDLQPHKDHYLNLFASEIQPR